MTLSAHQKPIETGFGPRPEPHELMAGIDLTGKTALVTGGYSGIGLETVRALVNAGAHVHVPARDAARAKTALDGIIDAAHIGTMDLGDLSSVDKFADDFLATHQKLDFLIGNAGIMACPLAHTAQGLESQIGVNHFGHFRLISRLMRALEAAQGARVVVLSSIAHRMGGIDFDDMHFARRAYDKWVAYGQSKSAKALLAVELNRRGQDTGIAAFSVHPGGIFTPLQRHLPNAEMVALGWTNEDGTASERAAAAFKTTTTGAGTTLWAATAPVLDAKGGVYCEDCNIAAAIGEDAKDFNGVRPWAVDPDSAARLWDETERQIGAL